MREAGATNAADRARGLAFMVGGGVGLCANPADSADSACLLAVTQFLALVALGCAVVRSGFLHVAAAVEQVEDG